MSQKIGIIGSGVVGTAMGVILSGKGYEITGVYDSKPGSAQELVERTGCTAYSDPEAVAHSADILFITTNDSAIQAVADGLADSEAFHTGQVIIHVSGSQSSAILDRARDFGASVLSIHPMQSFANLEGALRNLPGSVFSIEGDRSAYVTAVSLAETLGGEYFFIDQAAKPLYHAGACVVSNYLVTLLDLGAKLLRATGIPDDMADRALMPLVHGTLSNIENIGIPQALTGPISRGDISTVANHLECMAARVPELAKLYNCLGYYTAPIAQDKGTINGQTMQEFQQIFSGELDMINDAKQER